MNIFLDGVPADFTEENKVTTVKECYESLFAYCHDKKRAIHKAKINEKLVVLTDIPEYYDVALKDIERLEFFTIDQTDLFGRFVVTGKNLVDIAKKLEDISRFINEGDYLDALTTLKNVVELTHYLFFYHRFLALFGLPMQYPVGDSNLLEYKEKIDPLLYSILDAYQAKDTVEFSDLVEYELAPIIKELGEGLQELRI